MNTFKMWWFRGWTESECFEKLENITRPYANSWYAFVSHVYRCRTIFILFALYTHGQERMKDETYRTYSQSNLSQVVWVIDQVWGQDGWILPMFFFCVFMDRDGVEVHKRAKKERGQYQAILTEQAWPLKDLLYGFWGNFSCGTGRQSRAGKRAPSHPRG